MPGPAARVTATAVPSSLRAVLLVLLMLPMTACTGTPNVRVSPPTGDATTPCPAVVAGLPARLDTLDSRVVEPQSPLVRAWGDPAVVLRCGVGDPPAYDPTATCLDVNGLGWYTEPQDRAVRFTSRWSTPRIEVTVPSSYAPEAGWLSTLSSQLQGKLRHPGCPNTG